MYEYTTLKRSNLKAECLKICFAGENFKQKQLNYIIRHHGYDIMVYVGIVWSLRLSSIFFTFHVFSFSLKVAILVGCVCTAQ